MRGKTKDFQRQEGYWVNFGMEGQISAGLVVWKLKGERTEA